MISFRESGFFCKSSNNDKSWNHWTTHLDRLKNRRCISVTALVSNSYCLLHLTYLAASGTVCEYSSASSPKNSVFFYGQVTCFPTCADWVFDWLAPGSGSYRSRYAFELTRWSHPLPWIIKSSFCSSLSSSALRNREKGTGFLIKRRAGLGVGRGGEALEIGRR